MELREYRFDEVSVNYDKKRVPLSGAQREKRKGTYRYYGAQGVIDYIDDFIFDGTYLLIAEDGENLKSKKQNIAQVVNGQFWVNNHAHIVTGNDLCDTHYLCYLINSMDLSGYITGSAQPKLSQANLNAVTLLLPQIDVQKKIVNYIGKIDEKIRINKQINKNLEQQIEAILLKTIDNADTQPVRLGDYLYIKGRIGWKGLKKSEYLPVSDYRIINGESLTLSGIDWNKAGYISAERYEESPEIMLNIGDILLSKDGTIGKIGYVDKLETRASVASGIFVIRNTRQTEISTQFIYYLLKSRLFKAFIASRTEGSVIPHLYQKDFMEFEFQLPSPDDMRIFDNTTAAMFSMVFSNLSENERLIHLRDSLLPKLISGEIDVSTLNI